MGEQIEFPKNFSMYMARIMDCLRDGDVEKAIVYMKKAYEIKEEESLNILLVSSFLQTGQYKEALKLAEDKRYFYESDEKRQLMYVEILIENNQILQAENQIQHARLSDSLDYRDSWDRLYEKLEQLKIQQEEDKRKAEEQTVKELFGLASLNTLEQFSTVKEVYILPNDKLKSVSPYLFTNPYVHPIVRATVFSLLAERGIDEKYQYLWFDEIKEINPKETSSIETNETMNRFLSIMDEKLAQNPSLNQLVKNEIDTVFIMLYPFENIVIEKTETNAWLDEVIDSIEPGYIPENKIERTSAKYIREWITKAHREMLRYE